MKYKKRIKKMLTVLLVSALFTGTMSAAVFAEDNADEISIQESDQTEEADPLEENSSDALMIEKESPVSEESIEEETLLPEEENAVSEDVIEEENPDNSVSKENTDEKIMDPEGPVLGAAAKYTVKVTGTGAKRTIILTDKKGNLTNARVAIWSNTKGQDDLKWYNLKKKSDGTWRVVVYALYLKHYGKIYADLYTDDNTYLTGKTFKFTKAEYNSTINTVKITGSGDSRIIWLRHPKSSIKSLRVAVWTKKNGQDDLKWYKMKKTSAGNWKVTVSMLNLLHDGKVYAHLYDNKNNFVGEKKFTAPAVGFPVCSTEEEYITKIAPAVKAACKKYGYLPSVLIAQSCLENGYGIPSYWDNPEIYALMRYNNMVGMKSSLLNSSWYDKTVWPGQSVVKKTPEEYNGQRVIITDSFRIYDSIRQSFEDFLLFLRYASNYGYGGTPKYGPKVLKIKDPEKLITTVASRGYATDSSYANSVMRIIRKHDLTKYD